jgi:hypothetical protein
LHQIIEIPLFAILFDLLLLYCLFSACRSSRRERLPENFQDIDFEDLEQQQAGFEGKCH